MHLLLSSEGVKRSVRPRLLLIRAADSPLNNEIFCGVMNAPEARYYDISVLDATGSNGNYADLLNNLPETIGNIMIFPMELPGIREGILSVLKRGVNLIQLDRCLEGIDALSIMFDNYSGACAAVRHLHSEHSGPVYFLGGSEVPASAAKRFAGWRDTMAEFGYDDYDRYRIAPEGVAEYEYNIEHFRPVLDHFFADHREPVAIFAVCDHLARCVYSWAKMTGRQIGRDIFVVGFDDLPFCTRLSPTLSSVAASRFLLGEEAIRLLSSGKLIPGWRQLIPVQLVIRQSSRRQLY